MPTGCLDYVYVDRHTVFPRLTCWLAKLLLCSSALFFFWLASFVKPTLCVHKAQVISSFSFRRMKISPKVPSSMTALSLLSSQLERASSLLTPRNCTLLGATAQNCKTGKKEEAIGFTGYSSGYLDFQVSEWSLLPSLVLNAILFLKQRGYV